MIQMFNRDNVKLFNRAVKKEGLNFKLIKEYNTKYRGVLYDNKENPLATQYDLYKATRVGDYSSVAKQAREYYDLRVDFERGVNNG